MAARAGTMQMFTGDKDMELAPKDGNVLPWNYFCSDMYSSERKYSEVAEICERFGHKTVDLRPYFIEQPYTVQSTDKLPKVLELFRTMHVRALPVTDPNNGHTIGVITRADIFSYMSL